MYENLLFFQKNLLIFLIAIDNFVDQLFDNLQNGQYISEKEKVRERKKIKNNLFIFLNNFTLLKIF